MKKLLLLSLLLFSSSSFAQTYDYGLSAQKVADNTYVFTGKLEDFSRLNGGNIVNTGFIVTDDSVLVIDSGPSKRYAEQQQKAIQAVTDKPIKQLYVTHHHPDHFLGNQVYKEADIDRLALAKTQKGMQAEGEMFSSNMYRMVGDWMRGTIPVIANKTVKAGKQTIGGHDIELIEASGHTASDLMIFDHTTGVLFAGDLVFNHRAATTPHANIKQWLATLDKIQTLPYKVLVVGHGEVVKDHSAIEQTRDYLTWLNTTLKDAAKQGMDMTEVMQTDIPERFKSIALVRQELHRSVSHLFPALEQEQLKAAN